MQLNNNPVYLPIANVSLPLVDNWLGPVCGDALLWVMSRGASFYKSSVHKYIISQKFIYKSSFHKKFISQKLYRLKVTWLIIFKLIN